ncbi:MAG: hypothetical protein JKY62_04745 [Desulfocapsa sp.]|uniref:Uncharacterized protein n=1 Tax=Desulfotalea psychrophila TaxID=84980 RepID=A0ABS3AYX9_9BACT|nr:hypothetical protein [Desulfocapsa sp.]MBN4068530.1 hypothetical protein [Desulfotalea psychrophila]
MAQKSGKVKLLKGPSLAAYARKKAVGLGLNGKGMKLAELVWMIQEKEGHTNCFKKEKICSHSGCCWQLSCGVKMS